MFSVVALFAALCPSFTILAIKLYTVGAKLNKRFSMIVTSIRGTSSTTFRRLIGVHLENDPINRQYLL